MSYKPVSIPNLPPTSDPAMRQFLSSIKEALEVRLRQRGNALDAAPTFRDLIDTGLLNLKDGVTIGGQSYSTDQLLGLVEFTLPSWITSDTAPPAPTGLEVTASGTVVKLQWDTSTFDQYAQTEVWRATSNNLSLASKIGSTSGNTYVDSLPDPQVVYYYWLRDVSRNGISGDFNDVNGAGTVAGPAAVGLSASFSGPDLLLTWTTPTSNLAIQYYTVEALVGVAWTLVTNVGGNAHLMRATWLGGRQFRVRGVDIGGNTGPASTVTATVTAPTAPTLNYSFSGDAISVRWPASGGGTLPTASYRIYEGAVSPSNLMADQFATVYTSKVSWLQQTFYVTAVDTAGNEGATATITATAAPPSTPSVQASIDNEYIKISWSATKGSLTLTSYEVRFGASWEAGVPLANLQATSMTVRADWIGTRIFWVAARDASNNLSAPGSASVSVSAPSVVAPTYTISGVDLVLSWPAVSSSLTVARYEVRYGASFSVGVLVGSITGTSVSVPISWTGTRTFWVAAYDIFGNVGTAGSRDVGIAVPSAPTATARFDGPDCVLTWTASASTLPITEYEIRYGATFAGGTSLGRVKSTTYTTRAAWLGERQFWIAGIDQNGNMGAAGLASAVVTAALSPGLTVEVIDNNVLLRWTTVQGTLPTETYELRRGSTWATATAIGAKSGAFTTVFETYAGQFTYWVAAVDTAGNFGTPSSSSATVNEPPDYILAVNYKSTYSGTKSNTFYDSAANNLVMPVNTTETWATHFTSRGWTSPQSQITAGYPYYTQPGTVTGYYEEVYDYGMTLAAMKVSVDYLQTTLSGAVSIAVTITTAQDASFTVGVQTATAAQLYAVNFRYVKIRLTATATNDAGVCTISDLAIKLDAKLKTLTGMVNAVSTDSGGTVLYLTDDRTAMGKKFFGDVEAVTLTPYGTTAPLITVYDFTDTPNPLSLKVLLYTTAGVRASGMVSYSIRGY